MVKRAYPSRQETATSHDPVLVVPIPLSADELKMLLTKTTMAKTKKRRPRVEAMAAEGEAIELSVGDWSRVLLALYGTTGREPPLQRHSFEVARRIVNELVKTFGIDAPELQT